MWEVGIDPTQVEVTLYAIGPLGLIIYQFTDMFWHLVHFHYKNQLLLRAVPCYPELQQTVWGILFPTTLQGILARTASCQPVF